MKCSKKVVIYFKMIKPLKKKYGLDYRKLGRIIAGIGNNNPVSEGNNIDLQKTENG